MMNKSNITKKDLIDEISDRVGMTQSKTKIIVEKFLDSLVEGFIQGDNVEIRGFGRFKLKQRKTRVARNPRTGEVVMIKEGIRPVFEASNEIIRALNEVVTSTTVSESVKVDG